jgi:hypothetical protein
MTRTRHSTATKLRAVDLPEAFALATVATATRKARNPRDDRRALNKALRVAAVLATLALEACGGAVATSPAPTPCDDYAERLVAAGCDLPSDLAVGIDCPAYTAKISACAADAQCADDMSVRMIEACHGATPPEFVLADPFVRYAEDACSCADPGPCNVTEIVTALRNGTPDVACVDAYSTAMEERVSCNVVPMPTCEIFPGSAAERFAKAVCACHATSGDMWSGCFDNALGEVRGGDPRCLTQLAIGYESDCSGRSGGECAP